MGYGEWNGVFGEPLNRLKDVGIIHMHKINRHMHFKKKLGLAHFISLRDGGEGCTFLSLKLLAANLTCSPYSSWVIPVL